MLPQGAVNEPFSDVRLTTLDFFPGLKPGANPEFKLFLIRLRDHVVVARRNLTYLRFHLLYENSAELVSELEDFNQQQQHNQHQHLRQAILASTSSSSTTVSSAAITASTQQNNSTIKVNNIDPQQLSPMQELIKVLHSRGIPRQTHLSDRLTPILSKFQHVTTNFQHLHGLLTAPLDSNSSDWAAKQMNFIQMLRLHVVSPTQRPFVDSLFEIRQTPLNRLLLQELHSQYIAAVFDVPLTLTEAMGQRSGGDGYTDNDEDNTEGDEDDLSINFQNQLTQKNVNRLAKVVVPEDVLQLIENQTVQEVIDTVDQFNGCIATILIELQGEQRYITQRDLALLHNDLILRFYFSPSFNYDSNSNEFILENIESNQNSFLQQVNMMAEGRGLRSD